MAIIEMVLIVTGIAAHTADLEERGTYRVAVCIGSSPIHELNQAELIADRMFRTAGVMLVWHRSLDPRVCPMGAVRISVVQETEPHTLPGALAYSVAGEGGLIRVFYDRIARIQSLKPSALLAHVLVHEITHVLQGVNRHSHTGVMKARWEALDMEGMVRKWLPFTTTDVKLIRQGLANGTVLAVRCERE